MQGKVLIEKRKQELPGSPEVRASMLPRRGTGFIAGWGSKTHVLHSIAKERERESKQIHCMTLINFARRQEIEKIFPAKT